jgi:hypothetical protein
MRHLCLLARLYLFALGAALVAFTITNWIAKGYIGLEVVWTVWFNPVLRWVTLAAAALALWGHFSPD